MYNHERMRMKKGKYIGKANLSGFSMYSVLFYPIIVPNGDKTKKVFGEIYDLSDVDYAKIRKMELASGYKEIKIKYKDDEKLHCFIYNKAPFNSELIETGEWTKEHEGSTFNDITIDKETIKEKISHYNSYYSNQWNDFGGFSPSDFEDDFDTDNDIYDLLSEFPHIMYDIEIQEYIGKSTRLKRMIQSDKTLRPIQLQIDTDKVHDPYKMSEQETLELDEFWDKYVQNKTHDTPEYELDEHFYCACRFIDVKPIWTWDSVTRVWRCQKCGEFQ